jgi:polyisoprenoid-binding protein YceI
MMNTWKIDTSHTDVTFAAKHMMVTTVRGKFADVSGEIQADPGDPTSGRGEIRIGLASVNTGSEFRDNHLRSADFFDVENHPTATLVVTSVRPRGGDFDVSGELMIHGVTRPVTLNTELLGFYSSMEGARRAGFSASVTLNRKAWGLGWNVALESGGWLVSEEIKITIDAAFEEAPEAAVVAAA